MSGNISGQSLRVHFAEFELPDTPENNRIICPVTRRWRPSWAVSEDSGELADQDDDKDSEAESEESGIRPNEANVPESAPSQQLGDLDGKRTIPCFSISYTF